jgi:hypothetical protein
MKKTIGMVAFTLAATIVVSLFSFGGDGKGHYVYDQSYEVAGCIEPGSHCSYADIAESVTLK